MMLCRAVTLKCLVVSIVVAYLCQILITYWLIPSENNLDNEIVLHGNREFEIDKDSESNKLFKSYFDEENYKKITRQYCNINCSIALSAIRRAKTQYCKLKIAKIACQMQDGNFYPRSLPNSCPKNGMTYGKYLGCYKDQFKPRILPNFNDYSNRNSRKRCLDLCIQGGFPYAGVQYATECFCGNEKPPSSAKLQERLCNMKCSGAPNETCGGSLTINVFETGLAKFTPVTPKAPANSSEDVRIVFLLTLSGRTLRQVHRLINALYKSNHYFYIHVDLRHDYLHRNLLHLEERLPNVKLVKNRFSTIWAGISFWKMILSSMKDLIDSDWHWDFVINLSESDFPIKPIEELEKFLSVNKNLNFVSSHRKRVNFKRYIAKQGLDHSFVECEERMWVIGKRELPKGIVVDGSSDWMTLSREFVSYVVGERDELLAGLDFIFKHSLMPPESYFHLVLRNSRFCNSYVDNDLHYTNWRGDQGCQCHKKVIDWCGCSPLDFKPEHFGILKNTINSQLYFARKFEAVINQEVINQLEEFIGFTDHGSIDTLNSYWENVYNNEDITYSKNRDLLISHAKSITRINARKFNEEGCDIVLGSVVDIHLYKYVDIYWGNLIKYNAVVEGKEVVIETWYKPIPRVVERNNDSKFTKRLKKFEVGSDYDKKEMVFRNFANILGPYSEVNLVYEFTPNVENKTEIFNIRWIDPSGDISYTYKILVKQEKLSDFIKPDLKLPIEPGVWTAKLFENENFVASTKFLVIPLELEEQFQATTEVNNQIPKPHITTNFDYADYDSSMDSENKNVDITSNYIELTDELNLQFYNVIDTCVLKSNQTMKPIKCGSKEINICEDTQWSSLYPDLKGFVGTLNETTGKLDRIIKEKQ